MSQITTIRRVANNSLQAELIDNVTKPDQINALALLNKGDARFKQGSMRRAWFPITVTSLESLGVSEEQIKKIEALTEGEIYQLDLVNPKVEGKVLRIQVIESTTPDAYQRANVMATAKQIMIDEKVAANKALTPVYNLENYKGKNGFFLDEQGHHIFSRTRVTVEGQVNSVFISGTLVPETELAHYGAVLATSKAEVEETA